MAKYRYLTDEELKDFEDEFKHFLIANGLHAEEWKKLNDEDPDKAIEIVGLFSDLILEKVYDKAKHLVYIGKKDLKAFKFYDKKALLIGVDYNGELEFPKDNLLQFIAENSSEMLIYSTSKSFSRENRNKELHFLLDLGGTICDEQIFDFLFRIKEKQ